MIYSLKLLKTADMLRRKRDDTIMLLKILLTLLILIAVIACMWLFAVMPRIFHKPDMSGLSSRLVAHRGLHSNLPGREDGIVAAPENSMEAFRRAVEAGYGIELDVHRTKDDRLVVFHDFTLERMCGEDAKAAGITGTIEEHTSEELICLPLAKGPQTIPLFEDVLKLVDGKVPLIVEIKSEDQNMRVCELTDSMLRAYKGAYCVESFNPYVVKWFRKHHNLVCRGQLSEEFLRDPKLRRSGKAVMYFFMQNLLFNFLTRPDFIAYNHLHKSNLSRRICYFLFRGKAAAYTIKSRQQLEESANDFDVFIFDSFVP